MQQKENAEWGSPAVSCCSVTALAQLIGQEFYKSTSLWKGESPTVSAASGAVVLPSLPFPLQQCAVGPIGPRQAK